MSGSFFVATFACKLPGHAWEPKKKKRNWPFEILTLARKQRTKKLQSGVIGDTHSEHKSTLD